MAGGNRNPSHFRGLPHPSSGSAAAPVPLPHPRLPLRQRLRVHQPTVAKLLGKLHIEQTKSRPRQSGDNGLVETKNGAVIRKHIGYGHIDQAHAEPIHSFYRDHLNPYLNYHRPCAQPEVRAIQKGANASATSNTKLRSKPSRRWKPQAAFCATASPSTTSTRQMAKSDTDAARAMQQAKAKLFDRIQSPT